MAKRAPRQPISPEALKQMIEAAKVQTDYAQLRQQIHAENENSKARLLRYRTMARQACRRGNLEDHRENNRQARIELRTYLQSKQWLDYLETHGEWTVD